MWVIYCYSFHLQHCLIFSKSSYRFLISLGDCPHQLFGKYLWFHDSPSQLHQDFDVCSCFTFTRIHVSPIESLFKLMSLVPENRSCSDILSWISMSLLFLYKEILKSICGFSIVWIFHNYFEYSSYIIKLRRKSMIEYWDWYTCIHCTILSTSMNI